jgi:hypothetical protein
LICEVGAWTVVAIGNSAYARGQITFATLAAAGLVAALASTLIAGKTPSNAGGSSRDTLPQPARSREQTL